MKSSFWGIKWVGLPHVRPIKVQIGLTCKYDWALSTLVKFCPNCIESKLISFRKLEPNVNQILQPYRIELNYFSLVWFYIMWFNKFNIFLKILTLHLQFIICFFCAIQLERTNIRTLYYIYRRGVTSALVKVVGYPHKHEVSGSSPHKSIMEAKIFITSYFLQNISEVGAFLVCKDNLSGYVFNKT